MHSGGQDKETYEDDRHNREQHDRPSLLQRFGSLLDGFASFYHACLLLSTILCQPSQAQSIYFWGAYFRVNKSFKAADVFRAAFCSVFSSEILLWIPAKRLFALTNVHLALSNCSLLRPSCFSGLRSWSSLSKAKLGSLASLTLGSKMCRMCLTNASATSCCWILILLIIFSSSRMSFVSLSRLPSGLMFSSVFCVAELPILSRELYSFDAR